MKSNKFHLPKKLPHGAGIDWEVVLVDATEIPIERPKKQKTCYSGKKKWHTVKMQVMIHYLTSQIVSTCFAKGRVHDFKLFKISMKSLFFKPVMIVDKRYVGLAAPGFSCLIPFKAKRRQTLDPYYKSPNREINRRRIAIKYTFGALKRFKILSLLYRNRRSRIALRFNLIAAIFNLELLKI